MRDRLLMALFCVALGLVGGCGKGTASRPGSSYLPPELAKQADVTVAEVKAKEFAHRASVETFAMTMAFDGIPGVYVRWVRVELKADHVAMRLGFDVSAVGGGDRQWEKMATPRQKDNVYQYLCSKMTSSLATELQIPEGLIRVEWQNFNASDQGTFQDGKLVAEYPRRDEPLPVAIEKD